MPGFLLLLFNFIWRSCRKIYLGSCQSNLEDGFENKFLAARKKKSAIDHDRDTKVYIAEIHRLPVRSSVQPFHPTPII